MTAQTAARWLGPVLGIAAALSVLATQRDQGIARDEIVYIATGERYAAWWLDLVSGRDETASRDRIETTFGGPPGGYGNSEHPPLWKTLFGLSERVFHRGLGWTSRLTAHRLPAALAFGAWVWLVFAFAAHFWGPVAGALAGLSLWLMPRALFHAGFAAFDVPVAAVWFACLYCYARALTSRRWVVALGVCYGLLLATKHNAVILPSALLAHYLVVAGYLVWVKPGWALPDGPARWLRQWLRELRDLRPSMLLALGIVGPLLLFAVWPLLWFEPIDQVRQWLGFHLRHVHYNFEYLGRNWNAPPFPWHVPLVTTALVIPVVTTIAAAFGAGRLVVARWRGSSAVGPEEPAESETAVLPGLLLFLSAGAAMGPFLLRTTPIFGAEKHWMAAFATIAVFAGVGIAWAARQAASRWLADDRRRSLATTVALSALVVAAAAVETVRAQPYALSHYNALAGGAPGGADLGMNRQFWGYAVRGVLPWLDDKARAADDGTLRVYTHDASPAWRLYASEGLVDATVVDSGREETGVGTSDIALVIHERHFNRHDFMIWRDYGTVAPAFVLRFQGVPIVSVYERPVTGSPKEPRQP